MKNLQDFPRICLAALPTPIQKLENISRLLGTNIYIKRDDLTGIGLGGNKVRKLEFLLADAKRKGAEIVFTTGGAQSNHAMLTAACAKKLGSPGESFYEVREAFRLPLPEPPDTYNPGRNL